MSQVKVKRAWVKILEDELSVAKAHKDELEGEFHAFSKEVHFLESQVKDLEGKITEKDGYITFLESRLFESTTRVMSLEM